jgi:hypothetical protein
VLEALEGLAGKAGGAAVDDVDAGDDHSRTATPRSARLVLSRRTVSSP